MIRKDIVTFGKYAGYHVQDLPLEYVQDVVSHENQDSPFAQLMKLILEQKSSSQQNPIEVSNSQEALKPIFNTYKRKICTITDKLIYPSEKSARKHLREIQTKPGANHFRTPRYAYQCEFCGQWHLTSKGFIGYVG